MKVIIRLFGSFNDAKKFVKAKVASGEEETGSVSKVDGKYMARLPQISNSIKCLWRWQTNLIGGNKK